MSLKLVKLRRKHLTMVGDIDESQILMEDVFRSVMSGQVPVTLSLIMIRDAVL